MKGQKPLTGSAGSFTKTVVAALEDALDGALPRQRDEGIGWRFEAPYVDHRARAGFFLDLAGHLGSEKAIAVIRRVLAARDPWHLLFAAISLLRLGEGGWRRHRVGGGLP